MKLINDNDQRNFWIKECNWFINISKKEDSKDKFKNIINLIKNDKMVSEEELEFLENVVIYILNSNKRKEYNQKYKELLDTIREFRVIGIDIITDKIPDYWPKRMQGSYGTQEWGEMMRDANIYVKKEKGSKANRRKIK